MTPVVPKKLAKKSSTKPPGKEAAKKGTNAPFAKPRKALSVKVKSETWTEERWQEDYLLRKLSTAERRDRWVVEQSRKTTISVAQQKATLSACATATAASPWSCSTSAYISGVAAEAAAATPPPEVATAPAGASAITSASTPASALASASASALASPMEQPDRAERDKVVMLDGAAST
jgi:hypothetical protein